MPPTCSPGTRYIHILRSPLRQPEVLPLTRGLACGVNTILREAVACRSRRAVDVAREVATESRMAPKLALQLQGCIFLCVRPSRTVLSSYTVAFRSLSADGVGRVGLYGAGGDHRELEMPRCLHNMKPAIYLHGND